MASDEAFAHVHHPVGKKAQTAQPGIHSCDSETAGQMFKGGLKEHLNELISNALSRLKISCVSHARNEAVESSEQEPVCLPCPFKWLQSLRDVCLLFRVSKVGERNVRAGLHGRGVDVRRSPRRTWHGELGSISRLLLSRRRRMRSYCSGAVLLYRIR